MRKWLLLLLALLLPAATAAGADRALEAMDTLKRGFVGTSDFTADIRQEKQLSLMKKKMVSKGAVRFKKPDTFFMELFPPNGSKLLLKDNVMSTRLTGQGVTDRVVLPPDKGLRSWFAYLASPANTIPQGVDVAAERHGNQWTMQFVPREKGSVKQLTLNFDTEGRINRIAIEERNSDRTVIVFTNLRRNIGLTDGDFVIQ
jgi:outer membrane lipoprotein carrier protein